MDVRRVIPIVREQLGLGRTPGEQVRESYRPVSKVRESDDRSLAHAQHVAQYLEWLARFLQGLAENHVIESVVGQVRQRVFEVAVKNRDAARDGLLRSRARNLDATRVYVLVLSEPVQQLAFATSQIEHASVGLDELADDRVIAAAEQLRHERLGHLAFHSAQSAGQKSSD